MEKFNELQMKRIINFKSEWNNADINGRGELLNLYGWLKNNYIEGKTYKVLFKKLEYATEKVISSHVADCEIIKIEGDKMIIRLYSDNIDFELNKNWKDNSFEGFFENDEGQYRLEIAPWTITELYNLNINHEVDSAIYYTESLRNMPNGFIEILYSSIYYYAANDLKINVTWDIAWKNFLLLIKNKSSVSYEAKKLIKKNMK